VERLETVAPDLAGRYAVGRAGVSDPAVERVLDDSGGERNRDELERLAHRLDDEYFAASEKESLEAFGRARAVSAVWHALDPDALTAALEATYEAYSAFGDGGEALAVAERALGGS
jgi:hypothetical protein